MEILWGENEYIWVFLMRFRKLQHNSEAYDRGEQEIQIEFHGGTDRRDAAGTDGGRGEGCQGVEC